MSTKIVYEDRELIMMGFKQILKVSPIYVGVQFPNFELHIFGDKLRICFYSSTEVALTGNVTRIEYHAI